MNKTQKQNKAHEYFLNEFNCIATKNKTISCDAKGLLCFEIKVRYVQV